MGVQRTSEFKKQLKRLPPEIQELVEHAIADPRNPFFGLEKLNPGKRLRKNSYKVKIKSQRYRAICQIDGDDWIWYFVGTHEKYNKMVK